MARTKRLVTALWVALVSAGSLGCAPEAPPADIGYHIGSRKGLLRLDRVVLVEIVCDEDYPGIGAHVTEALFQSIQSL